MAIWVPVQGFGAEQLVDTVLNRPISQLRERTDYLYNRIKLLFDTDSLSALRITDVSLSTEDGLAPEIGDAVYLNPVTQQYEKAVASYDMAEYLATEIDPHGYPLGILIEKSANALSGTILIMGQLTLDASIFDIHRMLEPGSGYRAGPYYLSSIYPGKLTTVPNGPEIYIGYFVAKSSDGSPDYAVLNPQYRSIAEAHTHYGVALAMRPVGQLKGTSIIGFDTEAGNESAHGYHTASEASTLTDTNALFPPDNLVGLTLYNKTRDASGVITANNATSITADMQDADGNAVQWENGDIYYVSSRCTLLARGSYSKTYPTDYTCVLTDSTGVNPPTSFEDAWITFTSNDPADFGTVQVPGYNIPVKLGTSGLEVWLQPTVTNHRVVEQSSDAERRTFKFTAAEDVKGWIPNTVMGKMASSSTTDYSMYVYGVPTGYNTSANIVINADVRPGRIIYINGMPGDSDYIAIDGLKFEFDSDGSVSPGSIPVTIVPGDVTAVYREMQAAILNAGISGCTAIMHYDTGGGSGSGMDALVVLTDSHVIDISISNTVLEDLNVTTGNSYDPLTAPTIIYDQDYVSLSTAYPAVQFNAAWSPIELAHNLQIVCIPLNDSGDYAATPQVQGGTYWRTEVSNEGQGALYKYNIMMHPLLAARYPAVPLSGIAFTVNGVELSSEYYFPGESSYLAGYHGLYWTDTHAMPWPQDWETNYHGDNIMHGILYIIRRRAGDTGVVTSLQPAPDAPVSITRCGTKEPASAGDLQIDVDIDLRAQQADLRDYTVFKRVQGNKLLGGPVVSRLLPGPGYSVVSPPGVPNGYGDVQIQLDTAHLSGEFNEIALQNAKHEMIGLFPYIRLLSWQSGYPNNIPSGFTAKFAVPANVVGLYQFNVSMVIFGEEDIDSETLYSGINFTYSVLHDFMPEDDYRQNLVEDLIIPSNYSIPWDVPIGSTSTHYTAYDPMIIHTDPDGPPDQPARIFRVSQGPYPEPNAIKGTVPQPHVADTALRAGSQVAIQLQRADLAQSGLSEYSGALGIINLRWQLVPLEV